MAMLWLDHKKMRWLGARLVRLSWKVMWEIQVRVGGVAEVLLLGREPKGTHLLMAGAAPSLSGL